MVKPARRWSCSYGQGHTGPAFIFSWGCNILQCLLYSHISCSQAIIAWTYTAKPHQYSIHCAYASDIVYRVQYANPMHGILYIIYDAWLARATHAVLTIYDAGLAQTTHCIWCWASIVVLSSFFMQCSQHWVSSSEHVHGGMWQCRWLLWVWYPLLGHCSWRYHCEGGRRSYTLSYR